MGGQGRGRMQWGCDSEEDKGAAKMVTGTEKDQVEAIP